LTLRSGINNCKLSSHAVFMRTILCFDELSITKRKITGKGGTILQTQINCDGLMKVYEVRS